MTKNLTNVGFGLIIFGLIFFGIGLALGDNLNLDATGAYDTGIALFLVFTGPLLVVMGAVGLLGAAVMGDYWEEKHEFANAFPARRLDIQ